MSMREHYRYLPCVPEIEKRIADHDLDTIVFAMGPTAWLLPYLDQSLVKMVRLWGAHDAARIYQPDDLLLLDDTSMGLNEMSNRYEAVLNARPKRLWIYDGQWDFWSRRLDPAVMPIARKQAFTVHWPDPNGGPPRVALRLENPNAPETSMISPIGMTTLAWAQGSRRIGILGVDLLSGSHRTANLAPAIDRWFLELAEQATARDGCIVNLSPITAMAMFEASR
jgi:hypothetical protein